MRRVDGMKVTRITRGDLSACPVLPASRGVGMGWQKSAEAIRVGVTGRRRAEHVVTDRTWSFDDTSKRRNRGWDATGHAGG
jgi:hypothetical protein